MQELPKVGNEVYITTLDDYGLVGGLATVKDVIIENKAVVLEIWPDAVFNWEVLGPLQGELKQFFRKQKAKLTQDFKEKQNQIQDSCRLK